MKHYRDIQTLIDKDYESYISNLFTISGEPRKYFYWSLYFFETIGGLSFQFYQLSTTHKEKINDLGKKYFDSEEVYFEVNKNSHRHDISINKINQLFTGERKIGQKSKYEYIKEFIQWKLLVQLKETESSFSSSLIEKQKNNFLYTYASYLLSQFKKPFHSLLKEDYINYKNSNQGEELIKKLDELDREYVYDSKSKKEVKQTNLDLNPKLRNKLDNLYVLKEEESKIHFVFSRNGGGEKEELRELLEVMGNKETGKLYRGQANSSWNLDASITREHKYLENEGAMYYDILSLKPDAFQNDHSVYERLITMQHFGMPTRLLDITRNPLVAIFFACNNWEIRNNDGVIFTFSPEIESDFLNFEDPRLEYLPILFNHTDQSKKETEESKHFLSKVWFIKGVAKNQRINSQSGDFIFVGNGENTIKELHKLPKMTIVVDSLTKKVLLEQLESLNIHGGAVYPDLTHMSNYIRNKYLNEKSVDVNVIIQDIISIDNVGLPESRQMSDEEKSALFMKHFGKKEDKPKKIEVLTNTFDEKTFWTNKRTQELKKFAKKERLDYVKLLDIMNYYFFRDRFDTSAIRKALNYKVSIFEGLGVAQELVEMLKNLAEELKAIK